MFVLSVPKKGSPEVGQIPSGTYSLRGAESFLRS